MFSRRKEKFFVQRGKQLPGDDGFAKCFNELYKRYQLLAPNPLPWSKKTYADKFGNLQTLHHLVSSQDCEQL